MKELSIFNVDGPPSYRRASGSDAAAGNELRSKPGAPSQQVLAGLQYHLGVQCVGRKEVESYIYRGALNCIHWLENGVVESVELLFQRLRGFLETLCRF